MRLPRRLQGQKVKSQGGAGAYCGGDLAAQLVIETFCIQCGPLQCGIVYTFDSSPLGNKMCSESADTAKA